MASNKKKSKKSNGNGGPKRRDTIPSPSRPAEEAPPIPTGKAQLIMSARIIEALTALSRVEETAIAIARALDKYTVAGR